MIQSVATLTIFVILSSLIHSFRTQTRTKKTKQGHEKIKLLSILSISCALLVCVLDLTHVAIDIKYNLKLFDLLHKDVFIAYNLADAFYFIESLLLYSLWLTRIQTAFKNSPYSVNNRLLIYLWSLIGIDFISYVIYFVAILTYTTYQNLIKFSVYILSLSIALDLLINLPIIVLFIHKLSQMIVDVQKVNKLPIDNVVGSEMLALTARIAVLGIMGIMSTDFWLVLSLLILEGTLGISNGTYYLAYSTRDVAMIIDSLVIYLAFRFPINTKLYNCLCNISQTCCQQAIKYGIGCIFQVEHETKLSITEKHSEDYMSNLSTNIAGSKIIPDNLQINESINLKSDNFNITQTEPPTSLKAQFGHSLTINDTETTEEIRQVIDDHHEIKMMKVSLEDRRSNCSDTTTSDLAKGIVKHLRKEDI